MLAAYRAGIRTILLPERNSGALEDIPDEVRSACEIIPIASAAMVLERALGANTTEQETRSPPAQLGPNGGSLPVH